MTNSVDPNQTAPIAAVCSWSMLFSSILNSPVMLGNYLQQTTSADNIFRCIFSWRFKGSCHSLNMYVLLSSPARDLMPVPSFTPILHVC